MEKQDDQKQQKQGIHPGAAIATGVIIGAAGTVVGTVLQDKKNREKVKAAINSIKDKAQEYMQKGEDIKEDLSEKAGHEKRKATHIAEKLSKEVKK